MSTPALQEAASKPLDSAWVRAQFPSLKLQVNGQAAAFLDGPAGTQVPRQVMDAIQNYFFAGNANTCGAFATSRANDAVIAGARGAMADFFHCDKDEVVFGQNMTTITFALSRAIGRELKPGGGGKLARGAGMGIQLVAKEGDREGSSPSRAP